MLAPAPTEPTPWCSATWTATLLGNNNGAGLGDQSLLYINLPRQVDAPLALAIGRTYRLDVYSRHGSPGHADVAGLFLSARNTAPSGTTRVR